MGKGFRENTTGQAPRWVKHCYSGICLCGHTWDKHHGGHVYDQAIVAATGEKEYREGCQQFGFNETEGYDADLRPHCFSYVDKDDPDLARHEHWNTERNAPHWMEMSEELRAKRALDAATDENGWKKYPRTHHLPWSFWTNTDRLLESVDVFKGKEVVVTEKFDGENTTLYRDHKHARSLDSVDHASRSWVKQLHASLRWNIPEGWRVCGENLQAQHAIAYNQLPSYLLVFGVYNEKNWCLGWDETKAWCKERALVTVPELYRGPWDEVAVKACFTGQSVFGGEQEGYVVRTVEGFDYADFTKRTAKFVRESHVQPDERHWLNRPVTLNGLVLKEA